MCLFFIFAGAFIYLVSISLLQAFEFEFDLSEDGVTPISDADKAEFLKKLAEGKRVTLPETIKDKLAAILMRIKKNDAKAAVTLMEKAAKFYTDNIGEGKFLGPSVLPTYMKIALTYFNVVTLSPFRLKDNKRLVLIRFNELQPDDNHSTTEEMFRQIYLFHLALLREPKTVQNGIKILVDYTGFYGSGDSSGSSMFGKIWKFTKAWSFYMHAMLINCESTEVLNPPKYLGKLLTFVKGLGGRLPVNYHTSLESLHKKISPDNLPKKYGGKLALSDEDLKTSNWIPALESETPWIEGWTQLQYR